MFHRQDRNNIEKYPHKGSLCWKYINENTVTRNLFFLHIEANIVSLTIDIFVLNNAEHARVKQNLNIF